MQAAEALNPLILVALNSLAVLLLLGDDVSVSA
jgi:hypothetical protein